MKKFFKILLFSILGLILIAGISIGLFIYKMGSGFDKFEETAPELPADLKEEAILVFSKTNGFRHGAAIEASLPFYRALARSNGWSIFETENGAIFNEEDLSKFKVVIWNNVTGKVLLEGQRTAFKNYLEKGGGFVGVHGAGDHSHKWDWYEDEVIRAHFSHHNIAFDLDTGTLHLERDPSNLSISEGLAKELEHKDEWYVFYDNPREQGSTILYTVDENTISTNGNMGFLVKDKNFGMGEDHPMVWYHTQKSGRVFYSAMGHAAAAFEDKNHQRVLENGIKWAGRW